MIRALKIATGQPDRHYSEDSTMIDISADLALKLDTTLDDIRKYLRAKARWERTAERYLSRPFGFTVPSERREPWGGGDIPIVVAHDVGGPSEGRVWSVDRFIADVSPLGSPRPDGVTIAVAVGPSGREGETMELDPQSPMWSGLNTEHARVGYPADARWSSRQFVVQPLDHLWIIAVQPEEPLPELEHHVAGRFAVTDLVYHEKEMHDLAPRGPLHYG